MSKDKQISLVFASRVACLPTNKFHTQREPNKTNPKNTNLREKSKSISSFLVFFSVAKTKNTMCLQRLENTNVESVLQNDFSRANWSGIK